MSELPSGKPGTARMLFPGW